MAAEEREFTEAERNLAWGMVDAAAERAQKREEDRESLAAAATRACRVSDCGCGAEAEDYLTRPLEEGHRCPNPRLRT